MWRNILAPLVGALSFYGDLVLLGEYVGRRGTSHVTVAGIWAVALAVAVYLVWWVSRAGEKKRLALSFGAAMTLLAAGLSTAKVVDRTSRGALVEPLVFLKAGACLVVVLGAYALLRTGERSDVASAEPQTAPESGESA